MMICTSHIIAFGGLVLASRMWLDICDIWKQQVRMNTYVKISSCAVDILRMLRSESRRRKVYMSR